MAAPTAATRSLSDRLETTVESGRDGSLLAQSVQPAFVLLVGRVAAGVRRAEFGDGRVGTVVTSDGTTT